jgi:hypothetical protein
MIHTVTFANLSHKLTAYPNGTPAFGAQTVVVDGWKAIKRVLEHTGDHVCWIVTKVQLPDFLKKIKEQTLDQYLVVAHHDYSETGTTNRNYPDDKRKLKVFIMKGAK